MSEAPAQPQAHHHDPDSGVIGTLQSLIVAFVLAMTFRGFVAEGFVIPTGSMAPTLLGQHFLFHSQLTGSSFPVSIGEGHTLVDPMLGPHYAILGGIVSESVAPGGQPRSRAGDRILVLKGLYSFAEPKRWDVIVFKNPTDPKGEAGNYIKRLVGLPDETIWLADGDVFVQNNGEDGAETFHIERKPEHVQRALWQPVHHSDSMLLQPAQVGRAYHGPPWISPDWDTTGRSYRTDSAGPTTLAWNIDQRSIDDWTTYNMLLTRPHPPIPIPVSDMRVAAGIVADQDGLFTALELEARGHVFEFSIEDAGSGAGTATVRYREAGGEDWIAEAFDSVTLPRPGRVFNVEFWHVDQAMSIFINGRRVAYLEYDWSPWERLEHATGMRGDAAIHSAVRDAIRRPELRWHFEGSPVTLHRVRLDRDLHYRGAMRQNQYAFGTHPDNLAVLGPDHFFMLGDNSQASLDSRLWGEPHELIAHQIDDAPFVVHRKLLLGKAWVVYFPAPYSVTDGGINIIPDFGRLRYIR